MNNVEYVKFTSNNIRLMVICAQHDHPSRPCLWRFHASKSKRLSGVWKVSSCGPPHTCMHPITSIGHRNYTSKFICSYITAVLRRQMDMKPSEIIVRMESKFDIKVPYIKAWDARRKAIKSVFGSYEESYCSLHRMMEAIRIVMPGSVHNIQVVGHNRFKAMFWAFGPSIEGWQFCRPVLTLDGTFLLGKYRGTLLAAVGIYGNGGLYPLAFAVVENESNESWSWFLQMLHDLVPPIQARQDICFVFDKHSGIVRGCRDIFPQAAHRHCLRHFRENFKKFVRRLAISDCDTICGKMYFAGNIDDLSTFNRNIADISNIKKEAYDWLVDRDIRKWTLLHDGGRRYGIMTTNASECFNGVLRRALGLPIQGLITAIYYNIVAMFIKHTSNVNDWIANGESPFVPRVTLQENWSLPTVETVGT